MLKKDAVYIHIPFCNHICNYCDFCKVYYNKKYVTKYLEALNLEIEKNYQNDLITSLYIGGGTPSSLSPSELKTLFNILKKLNLSKDGEITFEANPDSLTLEKIKLLKEFGVNRISLGVETINTKLGSILNRKTSKEQVLKLITTLRNFQITNINVDLIYGINGETLSILKEDLAFLLSLDVPHISTYSLILEANTVLKIKGFTPIDSALDRKMYDYICTTLTKAGYQHYEISNFAKPAFASKHNQKYWANQCYYGFGVGASGYLDKIRYINTRSLTAYLNGKTIATKEELDFEAEITYEVILRLRTKEGIDKEAFFKRYHYNLADLFNYHDLINTPYFRETAKNVALNPEYFYVSNSLIIKFLDTLQTNVYHAIMN